ncbi:MAG: exodeoxyribonuclease VII small subunit [Alphaproteobacteria bacterium]
MGQQQPQAPEAMSFEAALRELEAIVTSLERGQVTLDEAIESYERGVALKRQCETKLREAQDRVERISLTPAGCDRTAPTEIPF